MTIQLSPEQERVIHQAIETGKYRSVDEVLDSAWESLQQQEGISPALMRSQLAGKRIRELRKGVTLGGLSIKELIDEGANRWTLSSTPHSPFIGVSRMRPHTHPTPYSQP